MFSNLKQDDKRIFALDYKGELEKSLKYFFEPEAR